MSDITHVKVLTKADTSVTSSYVGVIGDCKS